MSPIRSHADRREKDLEEIMSKMFCPLTPRRKNSRFASSVCKRTNCPCPPVALPAESSNAIETCCTNIKWWESVLNWLQDKHRMIDESLGKDPEDLIVLSSGPEYMTMGSGTVYTHLQPRDIIPKKKMRMPDRPLSNEEDIQEVQKLFRDEQREPETCSLNKTFYGPNCLPEIKNPSSKDMIIIKEFFSAHQKSMVKHLEHLIYLKYVIWDHLIPQVRCKIREKVKELKLLRNPDLKMHQWSYLSDIDPDEEVVDYLAPETEDDYPEQSDEEDEDSTMMRKLNIGAPSRKCNSCCPETIREPFYQNGRLKLYIDA